MYVYVYYVHKLHVCLSWLLTLIYVFICMISWMIRPPCEITDQLAVDTQNFFSTLFYTHYTNIKTSAQNAPKCTIARQKNFWGGGTVPSPDPSPTREGDTPSPDPTPPCQRSRSFLFTTRTLVIPASHDNDDDDWKLYVNKLYVKQQTARVNKL